MRSRILVAMALTPLAPMAVADCVGDEPPTVANGADASGFDANASDASGSDAASEGDAAPDAASSLQAFVSATTKMGDLGGDAGAAGADTLCTTWGTAAIPGSKWIALLWDSADAGPADRLNGVVGPWVVRETSSTAFSNPASFNAGPSVPINADQYGNAVPSGSVWTGFPDMTLDAGGFDCQDWGAAGAGRNAVAGDCSLRGQVGVASVVLTCATAARLYCLQIH